MTIEKRMTIAKRNKGLGYEMQVAALRISFNNRSVIF
jgi:hypothetical protein